MVKVKRPDGKIIEVTDKAWQVIYIQQPGYEPVKAKSEKKSSEGKEQGGE